MRRAIAAAVVFALVSAGARATALAGPAESERSARRAFQEGESHFKAGRFAPALERYQAGYDELPLPGFLINIAQCHRRLGELAKARATYQKFVMVAPDSPHVSEVQALIAELDKLIADLDGPKEGATPRTDSTSSASSGPAVLALAAPFSPDGKTSILSSPGTPPTEVDRPVRRHWWMWTLVAAAVAGAGATAAVLALSPSSETIRDGTLATLRR
jgi:hypothetical protein